MPCPARRPCQAVGVHDVPAAWTAWIRSLDDAGYPATENARPPADPAAVDAAQQAFGRSFPEQLRALYLRADGQCDDHPRAPEPKPDRATSLFPATYRFLPVAEAAVAYRGWLDVIGPEPTNEFDEFVTVRDGDPVRARYWDPGWWPLAVDAGGNALAVDTVPEPGGTVGQIVVAGADEDERRRVGEGVLDYLRRLTASDLPAPEAPGATGYVYWEATGLT